MKKKAFTLVEIAVVFVLILITASLVIPNLLEDNKQLMIISKWKQAYQNIEYIFTAINAQISDTDKVAFKNAKTNKQREMLLFDLLNPYFRMQSKIDEKDYKTYFLNGDEVLKNDYYYISNLHKTASDNIIGLKWQILPERAGNNLPLATLLYDLNGINKPNKWGYDIFGVDIYNNKIEPIGKANDEFTLKTECSKKGRGVDCSYYYYIYGGELK